MRILIKNGHIIDPSQGIDSIGDILIEDGKIQEIKMQKTPLHPPLTKGGQRGDNDSELKIIDAKGLMVMPGLVDMHVHLREPGFEYKETIKTGTMAAIKGGFTTVCCMPNTYPVNDNASVTEFIIRKAAQEGYCTVLPIGAITKGQKGKELAEIGTMINEGCIAFSDDGHPVMNSLIMRRALEYSKTFDVPVISHCEDLTLSEGGVNVTAETCPHYFSITEDAVKGFDSNAKVNPPLRTERDIKAIKEGLRDGTIDVIATDHAPHHRDEKLREFDMAPFGISGLETALSLSLRLVEEGILNLSQLVEKMGLNPSRT